jgi:hypothetical protein
MAFQTVPFSPTDAIRTDPSIQSASRALYLSPRIRRKMSLRNLIKITSVRTHFSHNPAVEYL